MEQEIIVLSSKENTGKTATMRKIYDILREQYNCEVIGNWPKEVGDFCVKIRCFNKTICLHSAGDTQKLVEEALKITECDVLVCTCRSKGSMRNTIPKQAMVISKVYIEANGTEEMFGRANYEMAKMIIDYFLKE